MSDVLVLSYNFFCNFRAYSINFTVIFTYNRKKIIMKIEDVIRLYDKASAFPSQIDISYLRNNFNPILTELYPEIRISWACNSCVKNQMSLLLNWLNNKEEEQKKVKKKKNVRKKRTAKPKKG